MTVFNTGVNNAKLNIIFMLDTSGSMNGTRIGQLNLGVRDSLRLISEMDGLEEVNTEVRIMHFDEKPEWILGNEKNGVTPEEASDKFADLEANRTITCTHSAIDEVCKCLNTIYGEGGNNYLPVLILVTDGLSSYPELTKEACGRLKTLLHGHTHKDEERTIRVAVGVEDANREELCNFASSRTVIHIDGDTEKNVPNVFMVDEIENLRDVLRAITIASISNSLSAGTGGAAEFIEYEGDGMVSSDSYSDQDDGIWEDI